MVSTQRFSIPGVPCLYLGTTSYVCWLEMDKPHDSEFNVYATSFSIKNKERKFKSEYIVSQLIMQCLSELLIDGIAYASKKSYK